MQTDRATWALGLAAFCHCEGSSSKLNPLLSDEWLELLDDPQIPSIRRHNPLGTRLTTGSGPASATTPRHTMGPPVGPGQSRRDRTGDHKAQDARQGISPLEKRH